MTSTIHKAMRRTGPLLLGGRCVFSYAPLLALALVASWPAAAQDEEQALRLTTVPGRFHRTVDAAGRPVARPQQAVADRLVVALRPGTGPAQLGALAGRLGARVVRFLPLSRTAVLEFPPGAELPQAAARSAPEIVSVSPDLLMYPAVIPTDPEYPKQWHHPVIRAPEAWDVATGSPSIVVAVIDSGVDLNHPDLADRIWTNTDEIPGNSNDDDGNGFVDDARGWDFTASTPQGSANPSPSPDGRDEDREFGPDDQVNHGTLVAGTIAASLDGFGVVGVAPNVSIMALQVFPDDGGAPVEWVTHAIDYAVANGADVINLSLGGDYVEAFNNSIAAAYQAGVTIVVAGGNGSAELTDSSSTWQSPVCNDGPNVGVDNFVIGVGATDRSDRRSSFSNYDSSSGHFIDLCGPGQGIFGTAYQNANWPAFTPFFVTESGTSFSSPIVAGVAALLKSQQPGMTNAQVLARVCETADSIDNMNPGFLGKLGAGRVNVARALGVDLAPAAVQNLVAEDTPDDDGGSVSLRWFRSRDDGAGANDVTAYLVRRARDAGGPWYLRATPPAGTETYVDAEVPSGIAFLYRVTTRDASGKETHSAIAGPVTALDDLPPPAVTGVSAVDRGGDSGGAIRVSWAPYTAPADFVEFRIYRSPVAFSTVQSLSAIGTVADASVTSYLDTTSTDGVDYWYAVTAVDEAPNEVADVTAVGPVQSFPNRGLTLSPGVHFLSTPIIPANRDPAVFFGVAPGSLMYARWDQQAGNGTGAYLFYDMAPGSPEVALGLGRGFWLKVTGQVVVDPVGEVAPSGPFALDLKPGWHQLGNPFLSRLDFTQSTVEESTLTMDLASADAAGIVKRFAWLYNATTGDYELVDRTISGQPKLIAPWQGFWVLALKPCRLVLSGRVSGVTPAAVSAPERPAGMWQVQVIARAGDSVDAANYLGVAPNARALEVQSPPAFGDRVELHFAGQGPGAPAVAAAFRPPSASGAEWDFTVRAPDAGAVRVETPDLSAVPAEYDLALTDLATGRTVALRTAPAYTYRARTAGEVRRFRVRAEPRRATLMVSSLTALPTPRGGADVRFVLTAQAACSVSVANIAGRPVRELERARLRPAGEQVLLWDGRNDSGLPVPNGRYLIRLVARAADGASAQALSSTSVQR